MWKPRWQSSSQSGCILYGCLYIYQWCSWGGGVSRLGITKSLSPPPLSPDATAHKEFWQSEDYKVSQNFIFESPTQQEHQLIRPNTLKEHPGFPIYFCRISACLPRESSRRTMATPTPDAEPWRLDEDRRKEFLEWFDKASFRQFKDGVYNCNDPALRDKVWDLLSDYYEAVGKLRSSK